MQAGGVLVSAIDVFLHCLLTPEAMLEARPAAVVDIGFNSNSTRMRVAFGSKILVCSRYCIRGTSGRSHKRR